jgi:hypothetical protein
MNNGAKNENAPQKTINYNIMYSVTKNAGYSIFSGAIKNNAPQKQFQHSEHSEA